MKAGNNSTDLVDPESPAPSETDEQTPAFPNSADSFSCCCQRRRFLDGNLEALAWLLDAVARNMVLVGSGVFLSTVILNLAKNEAGCETKRLPGESKIRECNNTVYGMKPSSLISTYATVVGLIAAVLTPIAGAMVDTTAYRRGIGRLVAALYCSLLFPTIFVDHDNWFAMSLILALLFFVGLFETMALYAYIPELTNDEEALNRYSRTFTVGGVLATILFLALITGVSGALGYGGNDKTLDEEIKTARLSQSVGFALAVPLLSLSWGYFFQPRPPARLLAANESIWSSGFIQIYRTSRKVHQHYPALQWFFVAVAFCDAGTTSLFVLAITFLTDHLEFSSGENGTAFVIIIIAMIPGSIFSSWWTRRSNPVSSTIVSLAVLIVATTLVGVLLKGPDQKLGAYVLAAGLGIGVGWKFTCDRLLFGMILPSGQNAEFSGTYVFFGMCLTWLPPLVFTFLNEADVSLRWGMASLNIFFALGLLVYYFGVGNYASAVAVAREDRNGDVVSDTSPDD